MSDYEHAKKLEDIARRKDRFKIPETAGTSATGERTDASRAARDTPRLAWTAGRLRRAVQQADIHRPGRKLSIRFLAAFAESVRVGDLAETGTAAMATRSRPLVTPCPHRISEVV